MPIDAQFMLQCPVSDVPPLHRSGQHTGQEIGMGCAVRRQPRATIADRGGVATVRCMVIARPAQAGSCRGRVCLDPKKVIVELSTAFFTIDLECVFQLRDPQIVVGPNS
jgi:hypothetical protein